MERRKIWNILAVAVGGALGSGVRYLVFLLIVGTQLLATLSVNIVGSFILGMLLAFFIKKSIGARIKLLLGTGFCGGFTTMSTVAFDLSTLLDGGKYLSLMTYLSASLIGGILAAFLGFLLVEKRVIG